MKKHLQKFIFSAVSIWLFLFSPILLLAHAQLSGCADVVVGKPPNNQTPPSQCGTDSTTTGTWPFPSKSKTHTDRVDQGWDMQYYKPTNVYAVASGNISMLHGTDPCGFGNYYPLVVLDKPMTINGHRYTEMYYGHVHYYKNTGHVSQGDQVAYTYPGACWPANWLEIGFWDPVKGPVGTCYPDAANCQPTQAGNDMKQWLNSVSK